MGRTKEAKAGSRRTRLGPQSHDVRGFQGGGSPPVVSEVGQTQQSASGHVRADLPAGRQMAPKSPNLASLSCGTPVRHSRGRSPVRWQRMLGGKGSGQAKYL